MKAEWIINAAKEKIYAISHAKAVFRGSTGNTVDDDLTNLENDLTNLENGVSTLQNSINTKQDKLTFDTTPTANSTNPVTSDGVKKYVDSALASLISADDKSY